MHHLVTLVARLQRRPASNEASFYQLHKDEDTIQKKRPGFCFTLTALRMRCYVASALSLG